MPRDKDLGLDEPYPTTHWDLKLVLWLKFNSNLVYDWSLGSVSTSEVPLKCKIVLVDKKYQ